MYERRTFVIKDENTEYEVLFDFVFEDKIYIVYTNYYMNCGETELFVAEVAQDNDYCNVILKPVESQTALKQVNIEIQKFLEIDL